MKLFIALLFISTTAFANEDFLRCTGTTFSDLNEIIISEDMAGDLVVTEIADNGNVQTSTQTLSDVMSVNAYKLSDWNGYTRFLSQRNDGSWIIEYSDECSGGTSSVTCQSLLE